MQLTTLQRQCSGVQIAPTGVIFKRAQGISGICSSTRLRQLCPDLDLAQEEHLVDSTADNDLSLGAAATADTTVTPNAADTVMRLLSSRYVAGDDWTASDDQDIAAAEQQLLEVQETRAASDAAAVKNSKVNSSNNAIVTNQWPPGCWNLSLAPSAMAGCGSNITVQSANTTDQSGSALASEPQLRPLMLPLLEQGIDLDLCTVSEPATLLIPAAPAAVTKYCDTPEGSFFNSRADMLQQLQLQQCMVQREHILQKQRRNMYNFTVTGKGDIARKPTLGPRDPVKQKVFALAKRPAGGSDSNSSSSNSDWQSLQQATKQQMQQPAQQQQIPDPQLAQQSQQQQTGTWQQEPVLVQALNSQGQKQQLPMQLFRELLDLDVGRAADLDDASSSNTWLQPASSGTSSSSSTTGMADPSRGLLLSAFLYCCSRSKLLSLTWQLGLLPGCLKFVPKVADADLVLHVKPGQGERHYQYDDYRAQAAAKGIPFVDLKALTLQELQLWLLPVFKLYAGEVAPRDLVKRRKPRGRKKRYTSIKIPPA